MKRITLVGECKSLFPLLSDYLFPYGSTSCSGSIYFHTQEQYQIVYSINSINSAFIDYLRLSSMIFVCYDASVVGKVTQSSYWIDMVQRYTNTPIVLLSLYPDAGIQNSPYLRYLLERYHVPHLTCSLTPGDLSLKQYIETSREIEEACQGCVACSVS